MTLAGSDPTAVEISLDPRVQRMRGVATHGNTPFDVPYISQIEGNLWQGGCESGLVLPDNIAHLVNLAPWWHYEVEHELRSWHSFVLYDSLDQSTDIAWKAARLVDELKEDGPTLVHCQAGLNRSSLVAAMALIIDGATADAAIELIREKRSPACLCNPAFESYLRGL